ncbi:MAG: hypothetical protein U7123_11670 [Potamolinea sp.]
MKYSVLSMKDYERLLFNTTTKPRGSFTDDFLREQDAYVPAFKWSQNLKVGQKFTVRWKNLECEDLDRMDYMTLH